MWTVGQMEEKFPFQKKTELVPRDQVFPIPVVVYWLSDSYKKISRFKPFSSIGISSDSFYLMIIVNWHLTFTAVCPKPDSKFL